MSEKVSVIAGREKVLQMTDRIAYQIAEENHQAASLVMIGIYPAGFQLAQHLAQKLEKILTIPVTVSALHIRKDQPEQDKPYLNPELSSLNGTTVILVDDVGNTGRTLFYGLRPLLDLHPAKLQLAVLVDRRHKQFPVSADFVGLSLNTTLQEHIEVNLQESEESISLY